MAHNRPHRNAEEIAAQAELCNDCLDSTHPEGCIHAFKKGGCLHPEEHANEPA